MYLLQNCKSYGDICNFKCIDISFYKKIQYKILHYNLSNSTISTLYNTYNKSLETIPFKIFLSVKLPINWRSKKKSELIMLLSQISYFSLNFISGSRGRI